MNNDDIKSLIMRAASGGSNGHDDRDGGSDIECNIKRNIESNLNEVERAYLDSLLEEDTNRTALADIQREQQELSACMQSQTGAFPQAFDQEHRTAILAHAQKVLRSQEQTNSNSKETRTPKNSITAARHWLLAQRLSAACLVGAVIWGTVTLSQVVTFGEEGGPPVRVAHVSAPLGGKNVLVKSTTETQELGGLYAYEENIVSNVRAPKKPGMVNGDNTRRQGAVSNTESGGAPAFTAVGRGTKTANGLPVDRPIVTDLDVPVEEKEIDKIIVNDVQNLSQSAKDFPGLELAYNNGGGNSSDIFDGFDNTTQTLRKREIRHIAEVAGSVGFELDVKLDEIEDDQNNPRGMPPQRVNGVDVGKLKREGAMKNVQGAFEDSIADQMDVSAQRKLIEEERLKLRKQEERVAYLNSVTADLWDEEHLRLHENISEDLLPQLELVKYSDDWREIDARRQSPNEATMNSDKMREGLSRAVNQYRSGEFEIAGLYLQAVLEANPDDRMAYEFLLAAGDNLVSGMSAKSEMNESINELSKKALVYKKEIRTTAGYQKLLMEKMTSSSEVERQVATLEMVSFGLYSIPLLIEIMEKSENMEARGYARKILSRLDRQSPEAKEALEKTEQKQTLINYPVNPWVMTEEDAFSTFALDTDTASYAMARNYIKRGYLPPASLVRMEEFVNAFDYNYPRTQMAGTNGSAYKTFTVHSQLDVAPYAKGLHMVKIGVKGRVLGREERKPAHIVLAIDASGSMDQADRLPLIQHALLELLQHLEPTDRISLVSYGKQARLLLEAVPASNRQQIENIIKNLQCDGSTDLRQGLHVAYEIAARHFKSTAVNRVVLCSDGVANAGETMVQEILHSVQTYKEQGITCTTVGVGQGAYNDRLLETLANNGDGSYLYLDSEKEAERVFGEELSASLQYIAKDAKLQVEFDPTVVRRYRLIGYENRAIADSEFRNDSIDAGEVGSGQAATAIYELELRNTGDSAGHRETAAKDLGTVFLRWKDINTGKVKEEAHRLNQRMFQESTDSEKIKNHPRWYLATIAAEFAEILRESNHITDTNINRLRENISIVAEELPLDQDVQELKALIFKAQGLPRARE